MRRYGNTFALLTALCLLLSACGESAPAEQEPSGGTASPESADVSEERSMDIDIDMDMDMDGAPLAGASMAEEDADGAPPKNSEEAEEAEEEEEEEEAEPVTDETLENDTPRQLTVTVLSEQDGTSFGQMTVSGVVGQSLTSLAAQIAPEGYKASSLSFGVVSAFQTRYDVYVKPLTEAEQAKQKAEAAVQRGEMTEEEYAAADFWLRVPEDNPRKCLLLFDDENWERYQIYSSAEEAEANMTAVEVPVWRLSDGEKTADTVGLTVHRALAQDVAEIFTEIFQDPEQFPVESVGGFTYRGGASTSEHNNGTAIDINPDANYQVRDGIAETGSHWSPGEDPYSISPVGSVARVFAEHGWSWGGDAWADSCDAADGYHDYMHFSYRGR